MHLALVLTCSAETAFETTILAGVCFGMLNLHALFPCTDDSTDDTLAAELASEWDIANCNSNGS
jgi:hypothetical protein